MNRGGLDVSLNSDGSLLMDSGGLCHVLTQLLGRVVVAVK